MTTDTQVRNPADINVILDEANLDAVNGGASDLHDACVRAALGVLFNSTYVGYLGGEIIRAAGPCP